MQLTIIRGGRANNWKEARHRAARIARRRGHGRLRVVTQLPDAARLRKLAEAAAMDIKWVGKRATATAGTAGMAARSAAGAPPRQGSTARRGVFVRPGAGWAAAALV